MTDQLTCPSRILLLGHRGAWRYAPQNTFAAFDLALQHGMDGFEFDLRCTRDRQVVICHNLTFNRLPLRHSTFERLQSTCAGSKHPLPSLEEILHRYAHRAFLNLEVKVKGIERLVYQMIKDSRPQRGYFISSFRPGVLREFHQIDDSLVLGTVVRTHWQLRRWDSLPVTYVAPRYGLLSQKLVEDVHAAGKLVVTWKVNSRRQIRHAADLGVDGIISADTKLLNEMLSDRVIGRSLGHRQ